MREKNILKSSLQINLHHKYGLVDFWAIWHSGTMSWPSGHLGPLEPPGNVQGSTNTSGMIPWHAGTLLACWHSRQIHGTGKLMMTHHSLNLETLIGTHRWCGQFTGWWLCGCWCRWCLFWVRAGRKPVHTQKPAQPHKLKINSNFEL